VVVLIVTEKAGIQGVALAHNRLHVSLYIVGCCCDMVFCVDDMPGSGDVMIQ